MLGIREAAMSGSAEEEPWPSSKPYKKSQDSLLGDSYYDTKYPEYNHGYGEKAYSDPFDLESAYASKKKGDITITFTIPVEDLGPVGDENSDKYDWNSAQAKATEIAYDRTEELLGRNYESKYSVEFEVELGYFDVTAEVTLTKNK
jgi:hypothetical protein